MNKKITLLVLSIFIVAVAIGSAVAAEAKVNTEIKILSESSLKNGDAVEFELKDAQGNKLASQKVNISFEENGELQNYSVITDKDGKGYLVLNNEATGEHKIIVNYTGSDKYNPSKAEQTITIVEGDSTPEKTNTNATASTSKYNNVTKNSTVEEIIYYDAENNFYYNQWGVVVGGQNDGRDAAEVAQILDEQRASGSDGLE